MAAATDPLTSLAESVADGESIDWDALDALAADPELRGLVEHLRVVAGVAEVHRTQVDESDVASAQPPLVDAADDRERWGHLALVRKLGQGAFGEVYLAHDTWLDHPRALKLLKPEVASRLSPEQLLHEARKLVRVRHPSVVAVHGADRHDGRVGFWMDYVDGQTLSERVDEECLDANEASAIGRELCDALTAVHRAGLIHRDIKAQNVMRAADGRIFLMDFGAGEFMGASPSGRPQGTPLYLAPELFSGEAASVQSDIYAVGVLLYHLVTGSFPVAAGSVTELIKAHGAKAGVALRSLHPDLPERFVAAVDRALDPNPSKRFASADEMREALTEPASLTSSQVIEIVRVEETAASRLWAWTMRVAVGAVALAAAMGTSGFLGWRLFELTLHVDSTFGPPVSEYLRLGREGVIPFFFYWLSGAALFAVIRGVDAGFGAPLGARISRWLTSLDAGGAERIATAVCLVGGLCWGLMIFIDYELFDTIYGLQLGTAGLTSKAIGPDFRLVNMSYSNAAGLLTTVLIGIAVFAFPAIEQRCADNANIGPYRWTVLTIVFAVLLSATAARRLAWDRFDVVLYENRRALVIASQGGDLLLYAPEHPDVGTVRVHRSDPGLVETGRTASLVDRP